MKKKKMIILFIVLLAAAAGAYEVWNIYGNPTTKQSQETEQKYQNYQAWEEQYRHALEQDTYGGETPEQTLQMFITALENEDVELASKYFLIETDEKNADYLTHEGWLRLLQQAKRENRIEEIIKSIKKTKPQEYSKDYTLNTQSFSYKDGEGALVILVLNKYNQVWKIESM